MVQFAMVGLGCELIASMQLLFFLSQRDSSSILGEF